MAQIMMDNVDKIYGDGVKAVSDLNLHIMDGEFMCLAGPSGRGKSTALRMIAGLEEITGGSVRIGENVVNGLPLKDRDIAMVFQNYALYPHMSVGENLAYGLKMRKVSREESPAGWPGPPRSSAWSRTWTASPRPCPAASASGSRWAGPSSASRRHS